MKRVLLLLLLSAASITASAYDFCVDGIYYNKTSDSTVAVTYKVLSSSTNKNYTGNLTIPRSVTYNSISYSVTSIGESAFKGSSTLNSVIIPNSVSSIGDKAFLSCYGLHNVDLPNSVTSIGNSAFSYCSDLLAVSLPNSVTSIGAWAFSCCYGLTSITIPSSVTYIGSGAFSSCHNVKKLTYAYGCTKVLRTYLEDIESVIIPASITSIGNSAFSHCTNLTSVDIPDAVITIGESAFSGCTGLTSFNIVKTASVIHPSYKTATSYIVPDGLKSIGNSAFYGCTSLKSITIPNSVTFIGNSAFYGCTSLTSVTIPDSVTSIRNSTFYGCTGLTSINLPNSVTWIGNSAFSDCTGLTSINLPNSVAWIGNSAFSGCTDLTSVTIPNILFTLSDSVFYCCKSLASINIPNSLGIIRNAAFSRCTGLTKVEIPNSVTYIGNAAFKGCSGLTEITIPNSVTSIGIAAFKECDSLTEVTIPNTLKTISDSTFCRCYGMKGITIPNSVTSIGDDAFYGCFRLTSVTIPNSVTTIGESAFFNCDLNDVTIPSSVTSIGDYAFYHNGWLRNAYLPDNIEHFGNNVFLKGTTIKVNVGSHTCLLLWNKNIIPQDIKTYVVLYKPELSVISTTQTTAKIEINHAYKEYVYLHHNSDGKFEKVETEYTVRGLRPEETTNEYVYVGKAIDDSYFYQTSTTIKTKYISPSITETSATASSIFAKGTYIHGDAEVEKEEYCVGSGNSYIEGSNVKATGLTPSSSHTIYYRITLKNGKIYSTEATFKTKALTLETQQPKVIKEGSVIVQATSNLDDAETNVGFEWRRTDWTDDFASNTGTAYLYGGTMEGYIRNLNTNYLWKYRPYYESNSGTRYYGEWVGLDPTNTSYFEPTVHTYAKVTVNGNTASVLGYAQRGTDDAKEQGFYFWKTGGTAVRGIGTKAMTIPTRAQKVVVTTSGSNPVMEATLAGLDYDADYTYVAYMTTDEGTYYGETQTFATGADPTGIGDIKADTTSRSYPSGIYDLQGRKQTTLQRGVNIVRYEDGSVKKVYVK